MAYVVSGACIDMLDRSCIEVCPVDCIYEGGHKAYVQPEECVDCGACEAVCPVDAIKYSDEVPHDQQDHVADNARFFSDVLPGRGAPLGSPSGAALLGPVAADTEFVTGLVG